MSASTRPCPGGRVASSDLGGLPRCPDRGSRPPEASVASQPWTAANVTEPNEQDPTLYEGRHRAFVARTGTIRHITQQQAAGAIGRATAKVAAPLLGQSPDSNSPISPAPIPEEVIDHAPTPRSPRIIPQLRPRPGA